MEKITVKKWEIVVTGASEEDFVSLTDLARIKNSEYPADVIKNWLRLRSTIEYLGVWEQLNNPHFKLVEFDQFKSESGKNYFVMTPTKWSAKTGAIGIRTKNGKYGGGTFAHRDIALEFASWISPEIKLYIIKEFQRLKAKESDLVEWRGKRLLTKLNYLIHTNAVKEYLVPVHLSGEQKNIIYANEADLLNVALFGKTAKQWRSQNPTKKGNIRDYASTIELAILSNLEYLNSMLIAQHMSQTQRLSMLNEEANREKEVFNANKLMELKKGINGK